MEMGIGLVRVLITDEVSKLGLNILKQNNIDYTYLPGISQDDLIKKIPSYEVLIVRGRTKVTKEIINKASKLKLIARVGVGLDNIDVKTARERGIEIINAGAATSQSVAELTIGLLITLVRPIIFGDESMRRGIWAKSFCMGRELYGKTLGIIGLGNIGSIVARMAKALGLRVIGFDVIKEKVQKANVEYRDFNSLLRMADIITLHVPLLASTKGMIGEKEIQNMKDGVLIINTARMELIDLDALIKGLEEGKISGYAADSDLKPDDIRVKKLLGFPNVILTPHIGAQTIEAQNRAAEVVFNKVVEKVKELSK